MPGTAEPAGKCDKRTLEERASVHLFKMQYVLLIYIRINPGNHL